MRSYFELDPNRVLDLVLEALEAVPSRIANRGLVSLFNPNYIPHMLGFKFQFYQSADAGTTPDSLYQLCAVLMQQGSVQLEQVLPHLNPSVAKVQEQYTKEAAKSVAGSKKIGQVSLNSTGGSTGGRKSLGDFGSLDDGGAAPAPSAAADDKQEEEEVLEFDALQPLGVLRAMLRLRDWGNAQRLMDELEGVEVSSYAPVCAALSELLDWVTAAAYVSISPQQMLMGTAADQAMPDAPEAAEAVGTPSTDEAGEVLTPAKTPAEAVSGMQPLLQRIGLYLNKTVRRCPGGDEW